MHFFIYIFQTQIKTIKFKKFISVFFIFFILSPIIYFSTSVIQDDKRTDYPGREIAQKVQKEWDNKYNGSIEKVEGDEWYAGNLSYHLKSRPKWFYVKTPLPIIDDILVSLAVSTGSKSTILITGKK